MKKFAILILSFLFTEVSSQPYQFVINGETAIYSIMSDGSNYQILHLFGTAESPQGQMFLINNRLYGVTSVGGENNRGVIYEYDIATRSFNKLHHFTREMGSPGSALVLQDLILYGTCDECVFRYNLANNSMSTLHEFQEEEGAVIEGLTLIGDTLYGAAVLGGLRDVGTLFSVKTDGSGFKVLHDFGTSIMGRLPSSSLSSINGQVYGVSNFGATNFSGALFNYDPETGIISRVEALSEETGRSVYDRMVEFSDGYIYCVTGDLGLNGYGTIFKFSPIDGEVIKIHDSSNAIGLPQGQLLEAPNGEIYGLTSTGGDYGNGVLYKINKDGTNFEIIFHLPSFVASSPNNQIIILDQILSPLSANDHWNNAFTLYPNLETNLLEVIFTNTKSNLNNLNWILMDISGKQYDVSIQASDEYLLSIDISRINSGVYFLRTIIDDHIVIKRFIKN